MELPHLVKVYGYFIRSEGRWCLHFHICDTQVTLHCYVATQLQRQPLRHRDAAESSLYKYNKQLEMLMILKEEGGILIQKHYKSSPAMICGVRK